MLAVITGGAGFLGTYLARRLAEKGALKGTDGREQEISRVLVVDPSIKARHAAPSGPHKISIEHEPGSVTDFAQMSRAVGQGPVSVFHLASLLPGTTERDLDAALAVNVDGARNVLEALKRSGAPAKFISTSTIALHTRSADNAVIRDDSSPRPKAVYGLTKIISENFALAYQIGSGLDVRGGRFPAVVIRPVSVASSIGSALSDILREISLGRDCEIRVKPETDVLLLDYQSCIDGLIAVHDADPALLSEHRFVNFPGRLISVAGMVEAAERTARAAGREPGKTRFAFNDFLQLTMDRWPLKVETNLADRIGVPSPLPVKEMCRRFLDDYDQFWKQSLP
jgi:nucleoside-diphosphate-sugar epimerase